MKQTGVWSLKEDLFEFVPEKYQIKFQSIIQIVDYLAHNFKEDFPDWLKDIISEHKMSEDYKEEYKFPKWKTPAFPTLDAPYLVMWDGINCTHNTIFGNKRIAIPKRIKELVKKRDNYTCQHCGNNIFDEPNLLLEVDHIIPFSLGGTNNIDNLQTLCWKCNRVKSNKMEQ